MSGKSDRGSDSSGATEIGITIRQLEYLVAVAASDSLSEAARRCHVSQPALVEQLGKLESRVGRLVDRAARPTTLTPLGEKVLLRTRFVLRAARDIERLARNPVDLHIGMIETAAPYLMPALMRSSSQRILPVQAKTGDLVERLRSGRIDVAVLADGTVPEDLESSPIGSDELLLVTLRGDRHIGQAGPPGLSDVADHEMLLLSDGHCLRDQVVDVCASVRSTLGPFEAATLEMITEMVAAGLGVTLVPAIARPVVERHPAVRLQRLQETPKRTLVLATRKGDQERVKGIGDELRSIVASLQPGSDSWPITG